MLKPIVDNSHPLNENDLPQGLEAELTPFRLSPQNSFVCHFQGFSSNLYVFRAKDVAHALTVEMTLEIKESFACPEASEEGRLSPVMNAHFPTINLQKFNEIIPADAYLQKALILQFQLKILEQLFLFCEDKDAAKLTLTLRDVDLDYLEIYRRFLASEGYIITEKGERIEVIIPITVETYDKVVDFMDEVEKDLSQTLCREQRFNPLIQEYLKAPAFPAEI